MMARLTPKLIYVLVILAGAVIVAGDHLTSRSLSGLGAPGDLGSACAPCGAPCTDTDG
ncbi:MAG: hypothetical protein ACPIFQ_08410 [Candidatus Puniceispirillaceae bacterium]|jgi:hypothetical protein